MDTWRWIYYNLENLFKLFWSGCRTTSSACFLAEIEMTTLEMDLHLLQMMMVTVETIPIVVANAIVDELAEARLETWLEQPPTLAPMVDLEMMEKKMMASP